MTYQKVAYRSFLVVLLIVIIASCSKKSGGGNGVIPPAPIVITPPTDFGFKVVGYFLRIEILQLYPM